jgi:N-dimethylarginine dimethylaminohydrolase
VITDTGVILMRDELERVRDWAKDQIRIGSEAPASWDQYVTLIESADAILHEIAVAANLPEMAPPPRSQRQHWKRGYDQLH